MADKRVRIRNIFPFKDYFKEFKKELSRDVLMKIYEVFMLIMTEKVVPLSSSGRLRGGTTCTRLELNMLVTYIASSAAWTREI